MKKDSTKIIQNNLISKETRRDHYEEFKKHMPYKDKVIWAKKRIEEFLIWCSDEKVEEITISFSGGKDSTVLFHLVNEIHNKIKSKVMLIPAYATEITFPSTIKFIKETTKDYQANNKYIKEPLIIKPKMSWTNILNEKGYPIFSKQISLMLNRVKHAKTQNGLTKWMFGIDEDTIRFKLAKNRLFLLDDNMTYNFPQPTSEFIDYFPKKTNENYFFSEKCCDNVKGGLKHDKRPSFIGTMASESNMRKKSWIDRGCNIFNKDKPMSRPLSLWHAKDVWKYIKENNLKVNDAYNFNHEIDIELQELRFDRLGCTSCPFGSAIEQRIINRLKKIKNIEQKNEFLLKNRFEKLKEYSPILYKIQIIDTCMYKILIDMGIQISSDKAYMSLYDKRWKEINEWYSEENFKNNLINVLCQIENYNNYKKKPSGYEWSYKLSQINKSIKHFKAGGVVTKLELQDIRKQVSTSWNKIHN